jgi:allantoicase
VLGASDEFFAEAGNLLQPGRGVFIEGKFTDRGKWMDGWESRRRRGPGPDHDWCVIELGAPGDVLGLDIDTNHFVGNHPPFASVDGLSAPRGTPLPELQRKAWIPLLAQSPLRPGSQNLFAAAARADAADAVTHLRLNIFPDGGVARLRAFGRVHPRWDTPPALDDEARAHVAPSLRDLAALANGGLTLACSDAFFGPMNNLLLPGRPADMGGGWETRRRRGPGHDWILVKLGARGTPAVVEVDTLHFKGNFPDRCSVEAIDAPAAARITDLVGSDAWRPLVPEAKLGADARHFFPVTAGGAGGSTPAPAGSSVTHVRLNIFPDGGVARLRIWGRRDA